jgi:acyl-coenzyme A synthetase/AMP-(fatty) acid ligase
MFDMSCLMSAAAKKYPKSTFILDRPMNVAPHLGAEISYQTMNEVVERLAAALVARGVGTGDVVAIYKDQNPDLLPLACAVARVGAIPAMLAPALAEREAAGLIARLAPRYVVISAQRLSEPRLSELDSLPVIRSEDLATAIESQWGSSFTPAPPPKAPSAEDTYLITHTSGTTGLPKLVPQARRGTQMPIRIQTVIARFMRFNSPFAMAISFVHARTFAAFATAVALGLKVLLISDPSADDVLTLIRLHQPGAVETHPNMAMTWEAALRRDPSPFANVRVVISTFDAIHPRTVRVLLGAAGGKNPVLFQSYGQTETGPITQKMYKRRHLETFDGREVGRPFPGMTKVRIIDAEGRKLRRGQVGMISVRSKGLGLDYLGERERYRDNFRSGWWLMGDHGQLDGRGRLYLEDRSRDRIERVDSVLRVEDRIIEALPWIREVLLVGDDTRRCLVYVPYDDATVDEQQLLRESGLGHLPDLELVRLPWSELPLTSTWKVRRALLVEKLRTVQASTVQASSR